MFLQRIAQIYKNHNNHKDVCTFLPCEYHASKSKWRELQWYSCFSPRLTWLAWLAWGGWLAWPGGKGGRGPLFYYLDYPGTIRELSGILPNGPAYPAWPGLAWLALLAGLAGLAWLARLACLVDCWWFLASILKTCPLRLSFLQLKSIVDDFMYRFWKHAHSVCLFCN